MAQNTSSWARALLLLPPLLALLSALFLRPTPQPEPLPIKPGLNKTVLFITSEQHGLANVHLATAFALLQNHPDVTAHYASFPSLHHKVQRVSSSGLELNPSSKPVKWHPLPGPSLAEAFLRVWPSLNGLIEESGARGVGKKVNDFSSLTTIWTSEEYWTIYEGMMRIVDEVDPSLVVIDHLFKPATSLSGNLDRKMVTISPNVLLDLVPERQPWVGMMWKYPAIASGFPFPVPWYLIPANIYINVRILFGLLTAPGLSANRKYLEDRGIKDPFKPGMYPSGMPLLAMTVPEANLPMDFIPPEITFYGPSVLDTGAAVKHDGELMRWFGDASERGKWKTVLVSLGSMFRFEEEKARQMAETLGQVLEQVPDARVLLKFRTEGEYDKEDALRPLKKFRDEGRAMVVNWLEVDPSTLLLNGHFDLFVHHGGGNSYHEAVMAGVPQVSLPMWYDCYNIASTAVTLGISLWPGRDTAPEWEPSVVADGIVRALVGPESEKLREKSRKLGEVAKAYGGRDAAAREIARLAGGGL